jgi:endonuclease IV
MKIGVKIWPDSAGYAYEIAEHADFIEVGAKRACDFSFLEDIDLPFVVHAEHGNQGVNYMDSSDAGNSRESLDFAMKLADTLNARTIIVHSGFVDSSGRTNQEAAISFLREVSDRRVLVENTLFGEDRDGQHVGCPFSTPGNMKGLLSATNKMMCLDFSHAHITSCLTGTDCFQDIEKFIALSPKHFHACGGIEGRAEDMHLHLWEGTLNIEAFKRLLPKSAWVTLETPCDLEGQLRDIEIMKS